LLQCSPRTTTSTIGRARAFRDRHVLVRTFPGSKPPTPSTSGDSSILSNASSKALPRTGFLAAEAYAASPIRRICPAPCFPGPYAQCAATSGSISEYESGTNTALAQNCRPHGRAVVGR
jgi:hypothetical protein